VIGTGGLHTCLMVIDGHSHRAGHAVNLAIDPNYRTAGPAIQLQRAVLDHARTSGHSMVCGITDRAAAVQKRAGYHHLGPLEQWTKILRTESKLQQYLKVPALAKCAGFGMDFALWGVSREARYLRPRGWKVEIAERFDARFDRLWERAAPQFAIVTERSSKFLTWRFRECSDDRFHVLCLCDATGELAGYAVYRNDGLTLELSDLLTGRPEDLEILIVELLRHVRKLRPAVRTVHVPYFGNGTLPAALRRNGFMQRPEPKQLLVWANEQELPFSTLCDRNRWYLTAADLL
jgi:GNAT superfamily N-acetyltransferase